MNHFWCLVLVSAFVFILCKYTEKKDCGCGRPMIERAFVKDGKIEGLNGIKSANPSKEDFFRFDSESEENQVLPEKPLIGNPFLGEMKNHNDIQNGTYVKLQKGRYEQPK